MRTVFYIVLGFIAALVIVGTIMVISYNMDVSKNYTGFYQAVAPVVNLA